MIVITSLNDTPRYVMKGDIFSLTVTDHTGCSIIIEEEITVNKAIDFVASFRFALEDGTCPGFHLMGVFACKSELPKEFKDAKQLHDLTDEQRKNFIASVGVRPLKPLNRLW